MKQNYELAKETKGTLMFKASSENAAVKQIYIQKTALKEIGYESGCSLEVEVKAVKK